MTVTYIKSNDGRRRSRQRCYYYDADSHLCCCLKSSYCGKDCGYISHCEFYSEGGPKRKVPRGKPDKLKPKDPVPSRRRAGNRNGKINVIKKSD